MKDVLRKIESDAQEKLSLAGANPSETPLARCKAFLKREMHRIKLAHQNGCGGLEICRARSTVMDHIIRHLWQVARSSLSAQAQQEFPPIALVALGGYGLGELNQIGRAA